MGIQVLTNVFAQVKAHDGTVDATFGRIVLSDLGYLGLYGPQISLRSRLFEKLTAVVHFLQLVIPFVPDTARTQ
jgi:hypothetical protein